MKKIQNKIKEYASNIENIRNSLDNVYDNFLNPKTFLNKV